MALSLRLFAVILAVSSMAVVGAQRVDVSFNQNFVFPSWCKPPFCTSAPDGSIALAVSPKSVGVFESKGVYSYGIYSVRMKLPVGYSGGVIPCIYLIKPGASSYQSIHDEIDLEFLGGTDPRNITIHTNLITGGQVKLEQFRFPFDPSAAFHTYTIVYSPDRVMWLVDNTPIRITSRAPGNPFPSDNVKIMGSIWDASSWSKLKPSYANGPIKKVPGVDKSFDKYFKFPDWCKESNCRKDSNGTVTISATNQSVGVFYSKDYYKYGVYSLRMKLPSNYSGGIIPCFYLISPGPQGYTDIHDEIDFEFIGGENPMDITIHTNLITGGQVKLEQFRFPFDPSADFHTYSIVYSPMYIMWMVDDYPIRIAVNETGHPFPTLPMEFKASIWDSSSWSWLKANYSNGPIQAQYREFDFSRSCQMPQDLSEPPCLRLRSSKHAPWLSKMTLPQLRKERAFKKYYTKKIYDCASSANCGSHSRSYSSAGDVAEADVSPGELAGRKAAAELQVLGVVGAGQMGSGIAQLGGARGAGIWGERGGGEREPLAMNPAQSASPPSIPLSLPLPRPPTAAMAGMRVVVADTTMAGMRVVVADTSLAALDHCMAGIKHSVGRLVSKGRLDEAAAAATLTHIRTTPELPPLEQADFIVEAVAESEAVKRNVIGRLDGIAPHHAVLASNTSSISITRLAAATSRPDQVIGMHFMNPPVIMSLVEVVPGLATSDHTLHLTKGLAHRFGKVVCEARDYPGFIVNRLLMPMINEAFYALLEGVGTAQDIDRGMKLGTNQPMGPLHLADLIGLDTCVAIMRVLHAGLGDAKYRPCPLLVQYADAGWLGRKSGRGVYEYPRQEEGGREGEGEGGEKVVWALALVLHAGHTEVVRRGQWVTAGGLMGWALALMPHAGLGDANFAAPAYLNYKSFKLHPRRHPRERVA
ncbi:unnamed protein product [Closterium sp. Naga37s-1]|nr:unnamed protein product [Closterium sp. Naga37s-1]